MNRHVYHSVHANQNEASRDLCWYNVKVLPTLAKGSGTYNKHYERTSAVGNIVNKP
jgi:hypothetical protein